MPDLSNHQPDFLVIPPSVWDDYTLSINRWLLHLGDAGWMVVLILLCVLLKCLVES